jgi:uncharacterized membrane protein
MEMLAVLAALFLIGGPIAGIVALSSVRSLREELQRIRDELTKLRAEVYSTSVSESASEMLTRQSVPDLGAAQPKPSEPSKDETETVSDDWALKKSFSEPHPALLSLQQNWMVWLGGMCVALAGIFLVRYSIEQGLLGPTARVVVGLLTGTALHVAAEYLRRKTGSVHPSFAAMAGAGSITLFASLLVGLRLFELISPTTAFVLMTMVALFTMAMAYIHGPVLAAFGILGAYLVPILTSSGGGQVVVAMVYALIISASALLLLRYVYRPWLWLGFLIGAFGWWLITLGDSNGDSFRPVYLAVLAYLIVAVPDFDWLLQKRVKLAEESYDLSALDAAEDPAEKKLLPVFLLLAAAHCLTIYLQADYQAVWIVALPVYLLSFFIARSREQLFWLPWVLLLGQCAAWILPRWHLSNDGWALVLLSDVEGLSLLRDLFVIGLLTTTLALWNWNTCRFKAAWVSLATLGPYLLLTIAYLLTSRLMESWHWGLGTALVASATMVAATASLKRSSIDSLVVWLFVAGHFGLALAATMVFNEASLTLAIAIQMVSLAWVIRVFNLPSLDWLLKLVVGAVIVRLTFNPWLAAYPEEIHWPLYSYGGATVCALGATYLLRSYPAIARWTEGAALHLFVLTIFAELRYQFHDGAVFSSEYTFVEACTYMALFASLGIVYYRRSLVSETLEKIYRWFSTALVGLAGANYLLIIMVTLGSDPWVTSAVATTPIFNMMSVAFGLPIVFGLLYALFFEKRFQRIAIGFAGAAAFILISLQIRHLWTGTIHLERPAASEAELYTYSAAWLVIAIAAILLGAWRLGQDCYRAGMVLLAIVIAKLFLVDMSGLEGLLRVASFMGLGLSLLAVSFMHQKLTDAGSQAPENEDQ